MLREVYLLENGMDLFHYSNAKDRTDDDFMLTSGFFSALESFSNEVRQANIDFFSSSEEIFLFTKFKKQPDFTLVIVCKNDIQQSVARELLKRVKSIINHSALMESRSWDRISEAKEAKIRNKIENAANSLMSVDFQVKAAEDLVEGPEAEIKVDQLLIYNYYKGEVFYHYHDLDLDEKEQLLALNALIRNIIPTLKDCQIGKNFDYISIEASNSLLVLYKSGTDLTVAISKYRENISEIKDVPFKLLSLPGFSVFYERFARSRLQTKFKITNTTMKLERGSTMVYHVEESLLKGLDTLERLQESFRFEDWHEIIVYPSKPNSKYLKFTKSYTRDLKYAEFYA